MKTLWLMVGLAAVGLASGLRAGDDEPEKKDAPKPASGKKPSPDKEAIRGAAESFIKAFNTRGDPSTCHWRTVDRTVRGDVLPVADEFVMVRRAPLPKSK